MTAAPCSTALFEFIRFVYGNPIMRFSAVGVRISSAVYASWIHACGLAAATSLNRDPQLGHRDQVVVETAADPDPMGLLEQRVHLHRHDHAAGLLARAPTSAPRAIDRAASGTSSACTVQSSSAPAARAPIRVRHASAPPSSTRSASPAWIARQARFTSDCGLLPPMPVHGGGAWLGADPLGDEAPGIAVAPRQQAHDVDGVGAGQGRRTDAGVLGGPAERLGDQIDRLERRGPSVDAVAQLAGTDQHRRAGVDHGSSSVQTTT